MILVDRRIGSSFTSTQGRKFDILAALKERTNGNASLATLHCGDFAFEGKGPDGDIIVGIERKALGDALGCMRTGKYAGLQAKGMSVAYGMSYLIVEGIWRPSSEGTLEVFSGREFKPFTLAAKGPQSKQFWMYSELDKFLCTMENKKNVVVVRSSSPTETVWQIVNRYQWYQKEWDAHQSGDPIRMQTDVRLVDISLIREMCSRIPGIGFEKSKQVEAYFGSVINMALGLGSEWQEAGFGPKLADKFAELMRKDFRTVRDLKEGKSK